MRKKGKEFFLNFFFSYFGIDDDRVGSQTKNGAGYMCAVGEMKNVIEKFLRWKDGMKWMWMGGIKLWGSFLLYSFASSREDIGWMSPGVSQPLRWQSKERHWGEKCCWRWHNRSFLYDKRIFYEDKSEFLLHMLRYCDIAIIDWITKSNSIECLECFMTFQISSQEENKLFLIRMLQSTSM